MYFTANEARKQFPALQQKINNRAVYFFDGPGGTQVPESVLSAMTHYLGQYNANLGGQFFSSRKTVAVVNKARQSAQALLNANSEDNIIFGPNMTSLTFQLSRALSRDWQVKDEIIVTSLDHYANVSPWQQAAEDKGAYIRQARINEQDCTLDYDHLLALINNKTKLVAITYASNLTGSIVDVQRIVNAAHAVGALVYVDAVHYAAHGLIDVQALDCDFLLCSAYKFFGPHLAIAYIAPRWLQILKPYKVEPATNSGPGRFETGTLSFEALAGLIASVEYLAQWADPSLSLRLRLQHSFAQYHQHEMQLSRYFLSKIAGQEKITLFGITNPSQLEQRTPTFALRITAITPIKVAQELGRSNICVWNGHCYAQGLCTQLGILDSGGVIRIGFMHYNTEQEIDQLFTALTTLMEGIK
ncbi:cysteine desulfurase-like protein [Psychromonas sp. Urea-02u-13]|uniref:cysteine desulfurase-like protein n=1 Tax=Psychromonas sp. Urea-02u-13 TaxID=2058326 RepID=UPI000C31F104|nr:cysteine desulfurase-like protein [Psychromonas sp. Urea-02u-13]PKG39772.1 cysteine desulfurase-like protein [Psychromonas sp. Urea-02u-13]